MELRTLIAKDIFPMCNIIKKIGIDQFKACLNTPELQAMLKQGKKADPTAVGMNVILDLASVIIGNLPKCEQDLYKFLASIAGKTEKEISELEMGEFFELIVEVVKKPEFKDFFKRASKFLK